MREHSTGDFPEHAGWCFPVLGSSAWVSVDTLLHNICTNDSVSAEGSRLQDLLTSDDYDTLSTDQLLGNDAGETTLHVALSVNN